MTEKIKVLDKGFVEVLGFLGTDLTVANSARVSFGKRKNTYDTDSYHLVNFLAKHKYFSPFRHLIVQFHVKAPEFVMQQWYKHVVGIETTSFYLTKDHAWNEISERYIPVEEHYISENWRQQSEDSKQASIGAIAQQQEATEATTAFLQVAKHYHASRVAKHYYNKLLEFGVAKELARVLLPLS